jgi:pyruvate-ferredoxin/flavodoxin oxidoreductase
MMGSGAEAAHETVEDSTARGEKVGLLKVHLYRPFSVKQFIAPCPHRPKKIAVLDRTKEAGRRRRTALSRRRQRSHEGLGEHR